MAHDHRHSGGAPRGRLAAVLAVTVAVLAAEVVGAALTGSLALLADAGHLLTDAGGIALALVASTLARRPPTPARTFGHHRMEILAAAANALLLVAVSVYILVKGALRLVEPPAVSAGGLAVFAVVGLVGNAVSAGLLLPAARGNLNARGAFLEVLSDGVASLAVLVAAVVISTTGWQRADAVVSLLVAVFILPRTWRLFREATEVLLEGTPPGVDIGELRRHLLEVPGVLEVHDLHAWAISSGIPVLSAHVVVDDQTLAAGGHGRVLDRLCGCLSGHFAIEHCTFQIEPAGHRDHEGADHA
ncbi:MAG TPA: cation diffusion facilitator family transporter [Mycobacteriales bacterium]|jgi:cation diffusion facilitator family transporter